MKKTTFSAILIAFAASILWIVAIIAQLTNGNPDGWVDAGVILYVISLIPLFIESEMERRAR